MGTPYYMSPEVCTKRLYSFACDMWALGCVLYELCALKVPFDATSMASLVHMITREQTPSLPNKYSLELRKLGADLMCRDHKRRPDAATVIQGRLLQAEMQRMLKEENPDFSSPESSRPTSIGASSSRPSSVAWPHAAPLPQLASLVGSPPLPPASPAALRRSMAPGQVPLPPSSPAGICRPFALQQPPTPTNAPACLDMTAAVAKRDAARRRSGSAVCNGTGVGITQESPGLGVKERQDRMLRVASAASVLDRPERSPKRRALGNCSPSGRRRLRDSCGMRTLSRQCLNLPQALRMH